MTKLDRCWNAGIYLGSVKYSNDTLWVWLLARWWGSGGLARVRAENRLDKARVARIHKTPVRRNEDSIVGENKDPRRMADAEQIDKLQADNPHPNVHPGDNAPPQHPIIVRERITRRDCESYCYSIELQCKRCINLAASGSQTTEKRNEQCRRRVYDLFEQTKKRGLWHGDARPKELQHGAENNLRTAILPAGLLLKRQSLSTMPLTMSSACLRIPVRTSICSWTLLWPMACQR